MSTERERPELWWFFPLLLLLRLLLMFNSREGEMPFLLFLSFIRRGKKLLDIDISTITTKNSQYFYKRTEGGGKREGEKIMTMTGSVRWLNEPWSFPYWSNDDHSIVTRKTRAHAYERERRTSVCLQYCPTRDDDFVKLYSRNLKYD